MGLIQATGGPDQGDIVLPIAECRAFLAWCRGVELMDGQEVAARDGKLKTGWTEPRPGRRPMGIEWRPIRIAVGRLPSVPIRMSTIFNSEPSENGP
jgi:hypothetical protein